MWDRQSSTMSIVDNVFNFHFPLQDRNFRLTLDSTNTWNTNSINLQSTNNRVTSIDSSSTNSTYPTSKAVYDALPSAVTESTVEGWGFTKNTGTITGITMNGSSKGTSGVVDLGTVITAHQDISGKVDKTSIVSTVSSSSTNSQVVGAKLFYDTCGDIETLINAL